MTLGGVMEMQGTAFILKNAHVITAVPGEEASENDLMDVLFDEGAIKGIGSGLAASGATVVDAGGGYLIPGLIDASTTVGLDVYERGERDSDEETGSVQAKLRVIDGIDLYDPAFSDARLGGITMCYAGPGDKNVIGGQGAVLSTWGPLGRPSILESPCDLKIALGDPPKAAYRQRKAAPSTRMGEMGMLRELFSSVRDEAGSVDPLTRSVVKSALTKELPVRIHAKTARDIALALSFAKEFGLRLTLEHAYELVDVVRELGDLDGANVIYGPLLNMASDRDSFGSDPASVASLMRKGVPLALTTGHPTVPMAHLRVLAGLLVGEGIAPTEALRTVTLYPAMALGFQAKVGTIEVGKLADLALFGGHPLDITARVTALFVQGRRVPLDGGGEHA